MERPGRAGAGGKRIASCARSRRGRRGLLSWRIRVRPGRGAAARRLEKFASGERRARHVRVEGPAGRAERAKSGARVGRAGRARAVRGRMRASPFVRRRAGGRRPAAEVSRSEVARRQAEAARERAARLRPQARRERPGRRGRQAEVRKVALVDAAGAGGPVERGCGSGRGRSARRRAGEERLAVGEAGWRRRLSPLASGAYAAGEGCAERGS